jgi:hypothetical protein
MSEPLDRFSRDDLEKLCTLAFWLGIGGDRAMKWGESRQEMKLFLRGVPLDVIERFERFLRVERQISIADEHDRRVIALPSVTREKALLINPEAFAGKSAQEGLKRVISPALSELILRWTAFSGGPPARPVTPTPSGSVPAAK